jgi:hypothetical protein
MDTQSIIKKALKLFEINSTAIDCVFKEDFEKLIEIIKQYNGMKLELKTLIMGEAFIEIPNELARSVLIKINNNEPFEIDNIIAFLLGEQDIEKYLNEQLCIEFLSDEKIHQLESDLFYSWYSGRDYIDSLFKTELLILGVEIPNHLKIYADEVRKCLVFDQYNAACSFCRTIFEASIRDIGERKELPHTRKQIGNALINSVIENNDLKETAKTLYIKLCDVTHGFKMLDYKTSAKLFRETFQFISLLYKTMSYK